MTDDERPVVLVVEDEPAVAESYELMLEADYDVRHVETGRAALSRLDDVDVVLLDRMLPGLSGKDVLARIRDRDGECRVAMVTAVDPEFDVIEMGFDAYLTKPPSDAELRTTIERLLWLDTLDAELQALCSLVARRSALESEYDEATLESSSEYVALVDRIEAKRADLDESIDSLATDADFVTAVREITEAADAEEAATGSDVEGGDQ
jgi:DNA-binding response OmpR family regulator